MIVIVQENHSFDNYFGTYPTANGSLVDPITSELGSVVGLPDNVCLPLNETCVRPQLSYASNSTNPVEGQGQYVDDYAGGARGFAESSGQQSMTYFDYHTVANYWDYAEEYGLGDNYFAAVLSETTPNRLMMLSGDTPVSANYGPPPYLPYADTLMSQLDAASVSWGYYDFLNASVGPSAFYPLNYVSGIPLQSLRDVRNVSSLYSELASGSGLPDVSFVSSLGRPALSEHPPFDIGKGEAWVASIVNSVMDSAYWSTTAVFLTWDEGGGFYDNVVPPQEYTVDHGFSSALLGLGQRVPLIVISPFSKEGYVSATLLSHLSLLHFIEYNWEIPPLNADVSAAALPLDFFNFSQPPRAPMQIPSDPNYPLPLQVPLGEARASAAPVERQLDVESGVALVVLAVTVLVIWELGPRRKKRLSRT